MQILPALIYYEELLKAVQQAQTRVVLQAMVVSSGDLTGRIFEAMADAALRGVRVHVIGDCFTLHLAGRSPGDTPRRHAKRVEETKLAMARIEACGGRVDYVGKIGLNPYAQRYHTKLTVVDNRWFSFGGVNFMDAAFANQDFMLSGASEKIADQLAAIALLSTRRRRHDLDLALTDDSRLLFDCGKARKSVIYDKAVKAVQEAEKVWYVSQLVPSGRLARALKKTNTVYYYNRIDQLAAPANLAAFVDEQKYRLRNSYQGKAYIHAKYMLMQNKDGTRTLITGSNNFNYRGIAYGTQEIALLSHNAELWNRIYKYTQASIA